MLIQGKSIKLRNFQPQLSFSNNLMILKISDFINYKYALFVGNSLRKGNVKIFNMFTPLGLNHINNTFATTSHLLDIDQKHY